MNKLQVADIDFNDNGTPVSKEFDDIYYSQEDGLTESEYVFQQGNQLQQRWLNWEQRHFVIAETGFGTGLNFLAVCEQFQQFLSQNPEHKLQQLYFISFEKYPLDKSTLEQSLIQWPQVDTWSKRLIKQYPSLVAGPHRLTISDDIKLELWLGDILEQAQYISPRSNGIVDAWFLDGFAPSKNPDMWQPELFKQIVRLSHPNATLATFTAAGFVRRGLIDVGFDMKKRAGFGRKREMLVGQLTRKIQIQPSEYALLSPAPSRQGNVKSVIIVGGGIAAVCTAESLVKRGFDVTLLTEDALASNASGNRQGALYPLLQLQHNLISEFNAKAFEFSQRYYQRKYTEFDFAFDDCGVLQLAFNDDRQRRLQQLADSAIWPNSLVKPINKVEAQALAGIPLSDPAWYYPTGGWLNPVSFIQGLIQQLQLTGKFEYFEKCQVADITRGETNWLLNTKKSVFSADIVVLANGHKANQFTISQHLPITPVRGQVSHLNSTEALNSLNTVICHKGYLTPNWQNLHCAGASFIKDNDDASVNEAEDLANIEQQRDFLPELASSFCDENLASSRAAIRATTKDHLPIVGSLFEPEKLKASHHDLWKGQAITKQTTQLPNIYCLAGLGSRGLSTAPFLSELLVNMICDEPIALSEQLISALAPNRFLIKQLIRREI